MTTTTTTTDEPLDLILIDDNGNVERTTDAELIRDNPDDAEDPESELGAALAALREGSEQECIGGGAAPFMTLRRADAPDAALDEDWNAPCPGCESTGPEHFKGCERLVTKTMLVTLPYEDSATRKAARESIADRYPTLGWRTVSGDDYVTDQVVLQATEAQLESDVDVACYCVVEECEVHDDGAIEVRGTHETSWVREIEEA